MDIVQIISEHKRIRRMQKDGREASPVKPGMRRVQAVLRYKGQLYTRHVDVPREKLSA